MKSVLTLEHVSKKYRRHVGRPQSFMEAFVNRWRPGSKSHSTDFWIVRDLSFGLSPGQAIGIIGDNGSGKSTILKLAAQIVEPTSGRVSIAGRVGALLEVGVGFHPDLTGRENVFLSGAIIGLSRSQMSRRFDAIVAFSGVEDFIDMPVRHYSSGMLVRLGFSVATSVDPDILLVDEVLAVGDYSFHHNCLDRIAQLQSDGTAILYVSHNLDEIRGVCDRVIWLHNASVELDGPANHVVKAYVNHNLRDRGLVVTELGDEEHRGRQLGSGGLEIVDCEPVNEQGRPVGYGVNGEPFVLRIRYSCSKPLSQVVFGVSIYSEEGLRIVSADSEPLADLPVTDDASIYLVFDELGLQQGNYELSVAAHNPQSREYQPYAHHHRAYDLKIEAGRVKQESLVRLPYRWTTKLRAGKSPS